MARNANAGARRPVPANTDEINGGLRNLLRGYNDRDAEATNRHLKTLRDALERNDGDVITTRFGGSVAKHTFVDGLSDVDVLFIVNNSSLSGQPPDAAIRYMRNLFQRRLPGTPITAGDMAVTVKFADGIEIQVLPAIRRRSGGVRVADPERGGWSNVVHPECFASKLTEVNQANHGEVIPVIKLAKALAAEVIQSKRYQISGYHMESLGIEAFDNYRGPYDLRSMLLHLCAAAATTVLHPIADSTGQSRNVDDYMGAANSQRRQRAARRFNEMAQQLNACQSAADVTALFGESNG